MKLLPLATQPFAAPTDRDMLPSERREFVRTHRTCIYGYARSVGGGDSPTGSVDSSVALHFDTDGRLKVYDGDVPEWVTLTNHTRCP